MSKSINTRAVPSNALIEQRIVSDHLTSWWHAPRSMITLQDMKAVTALEKSAADLERKAFDLLSEAQDKRYRAEAIRQRIKALAEERNVIAEEHSIEDRVRAEAAIDYTPARMATPEEAERDFAAMEEY